MIADIPTVELLCSHSLGMVVGLKEDFPGVEIFQGTFKNISMPKGQRKNL